MSPETRFRSFVNILETYWLSIAVSNSGAFYEYNRDRPKPCREGEGRRVVTCDQAVSWETKQKPDRRLGGPGWCTKIRNERNTEKIEQAGSTRERFPYKNGRDPFRFLLEKS